MDKPTLSSDVEVASQMAAILKKRRLQVTRAGRGLICRGTFEEREELSAELQRLIPPGFHLSRYSENLYHLHCWLVISDGACDVCGSSPCRAGCTS